MDARSRSLSRLVAPLVILAASAGLALWGRGSSPGAFLGAGMGLAVLFAGSLTLAGMEWLGGAELSATLSTAVRTILGASTLLLLVHFGTLQVRRAGVARALERGSRAAASIEAACRDGKQVRSLAEAGVVGEAAEGLVFLPRESCAFQICFDAPGGRSCYDSATRQWQVRL